MKKVLASILIIFVLVVLTGAYAGLEPMASFVDTTTRNVVELADEIAWWWTGYSNRPSGTYEATAPGPEQSITFGSNELEMYDEIEGTKTYQYSISENGDKITTKDAADGETTTEDFQFNREDRTVVVGDREYRKK